MWKDSEKTDLNLEIKVSIICNTYNHEQYIRKAIEGFLKQKCKFAFEVLIHDDASTDATQSIIKEYETKFPEVIKPVYQNKNIYSVNPQLISEIQYSRIKGQYVAFCEGDDYWIDEYKLQKQVEALDARPDIDICTHAAWIYQNGNRIGFVAPKKNDCVLTVEEVIKGKGGYVATNSWLIRKEVIDTLPGFAKKYPIDYAYQVYASLRGGMYFLAEYMSVYNFMNDGSWSKKRKTDVDFSINESKKMLDLYEQMDEFTKYRYSSVIEVLKIYYEYEIEWYRGNTLDILKNKEFMKILSYKEKMLLLFRLCLPSVYDYFWKMKNKI